LYETFTRNPHVVHYQLKNGKCSIRKDGGIVTTDIQFICHHDYWVSPAGITLNDVIIFGWIVNGTIEEEYYYAKNFGLVKWWGKGRGESYICEIHSGRPDLVREVIPCLPYYELYYAPAPELEPVPEEETMIEPNFPVYSQRDPRWKDELLGFSSLTLGGYGCAVTAAAMVANLAANCEITPSDLNKLLQDASGFEQAYIKWYKVAEVVGGMEYTIWKDWVYVAADINALYACLEDGPVIIQVDYKPATVTPDSHFVVAYARANNNDLWIADPYYGDCVMLLGCGRYSLLGWNLARAVYGIRVYAITGDEIEPEPEPEPEPLIVRIIAPEGVRIVLE